jgi:hypothetical protein
MNTICKDGVFVFKIVPSLRGSVQRFAGQADEAIPFL